MARRNKNQEKEIARERIATLHKLTLENASSHPARADRYAELAWRIKTRYQLRRTPTEPTTCRACHTHLHPGTTARTRLTGNRISTTCLKCGTTRRRPLTRRT